MTTYTVRILSGSTSGLPIEVNATSSPGTTIHTCGATATSHFEQIHVDAHRSSTATGAQLLTLEWGGTSTGEQIKALIDENTGPYILSRGYQLTASDSIVRAFATATGLFCITGWVSRAT